MASRACALTAAIGIQAIDTAAYATFHNRNAIFNVYFRFRTIRIYENYQRHLAYLPLIFISYFVTPRTHLIRNYRALMNSNIIYTHRACRARRISQRQ